MGYMTIQNEINEQMRAILIDWIIEVHFQFNLREETLYMAILIIDTYRQETPDLPTWQTPDRHRCR